MISEQITFSIPEIFSLLGVVQCVYILVYMLFRSGSPSRAVLPVIYFIVLGGAFFLDFAARFIGGFTDYYQVLQWTLWFYGPPLSVLLIIQIAQINKLPSIVNYWVVFLIPLSLFVSFIMAGKSTACEEIETIYCDRFYEWLALTGLLSGVFSMMAVWFLRYIMHDLYSQKEGKARYWLILTIVVVNLLFLEIVLLGISNVIIADDVVLIRSLLGIFLVYLAGTSLFRIYPQALILISRSQERKEMSDDEIILAKRIEDMINLEKVYHEATYSRSDMARELEISESVISKVINVHFGKNFPQLMNERRVEDAKLLLLETKESVRTIAKEVGFNSLASFNRVFREISGTTPSSFREQTLDKGKL
jgi:AraC-like DNA-binding protein